MTRITTASLSLNTERNLQAAMTRLATIQNKAGTQKEIGRPSDDPAGTANAMAVRAAAAPERTVLPQRAGCQRLALHHGQCPDHATDLLQQVRDLTVKGANDGALTPDAKKAIALELDQLHDALVNVANTQFMGRHVFAGTSDEASAYDSTTQQFNGTSGVDRRIGPNSSVRVDADGGTAFGHGREQRLSTRDEVDRLKP